MKVSRLLTLNVMDVRNESISKRVRGYQQYTATEPGISGAICNALIVIKGSLEVLPNNRKI